MYKNYLLMLLIFICSSVLYSSNILSINNDYISKIRGCILGAVVCDMLGGPVEFIQDPDLISKKYIRNDSVDISLLPYVTTKDGRRIIPYTDDTGMTLCVLKGICNWHNSYNKEHSIIYTIACEFVNDLNNTLGWAQPSRAPGNACLKNVRKFASVLKQGNSDYDISLFSQEKPVWMVGGAMDGGCGSVMRAHPFGLLYFQNPTKAAFYSRLQSTITHAAPIAIAACESFAIGIAHAMNSTMSPEQIARSMIDTAQVTDPSTAQLLEQALMYAQNPEKYDSTIVFKELLGWAAHEALAAGLYCFLRYPYDMKRAITLAVMTPGDSDSIATIAGALVGAYNGQGCLPGDWLEYIENKNEIENLIEQFSTHCVVH